MKKYLSKLDILVILLETSYQLTMVKVVTLDFIPINSHVTLSILMCVFYYIRYGFNLQFNSYVGKSFVVKVFFLIYLFDILQIAYYEPLSALSRTFSMINMYMFMAYIYNLLRKWPDIPYINRVHIVAAPYMCFALFNVAIVIIAAVLIWVGLIDATSNELAVNSITRTNVESGQVYYYPHYISVVTSNSRLFSLLGIPMITGLSHEPHVLNYFVLPAMFLLLSIERLTKYKMFIYAVFFINLIFATSSTAIMCFGALFFIDFIWSLIVNRKLTNLLPIVLFVFILIFLGASIIDMLQNELLRKTVQDISSMGYSQNILRYLLSPETLFGEGNCPREFGYKMTSGNVGFITFLLDITFFLSVLINCIKLVLNRNQKIHYIGLAALYFTLHTLKVPILFYGYPLFGLLLLFNVYTNHEVRKAI